jgi:restriction system protein
MPIPDYQSIMLPLLESLEDKEEHYIRDVIDELSAKFKLDDNEKIELLPSGQQPIFDNRVGWARTYLKKALLLESTKRGYFKITERGTELLRKKPNGINAKFLMQYEEFTDFKKRTEKQEIEEETHEKNNDKTPQESIEYGYFKLRRDLSQELLDYTKNSSPKFFEKLVVDLLLKMGYGGSLKDAGKAIGKSGDGGIDGIIKEDKLGLDAIYIQAKRWEGVVGSKEIRNFVGSLVGQKATKGVFITTSNFTKDAWEYINTIQHKVILIDGEQLAQYMIDYDIGVAKVTAYEIKRIDSDYFTEE